MITSKTIGVELTMSSDLGLHKTLVSIEDLLV